MTPLRLGETTIVLEYVVAWRVESVPAWALEGNAPRRDDKVTITRIWLQRPVADFYVRGDHSEALQSAMVGVSQGG